jgi:hypothetical protein
MAEARRVWDDEPLLLEALEADQLVDSKRPLGRRSLGPGTRILMWALRAYVLFSFAVVIDRIVQVVRGA